jgi:hypothetical protein
MPNPLTVVIHDALHRNPEPARLRPAVVIPFEHYPAGIMREQLLPFALI